MDNLIGNNNLIIMVNNDGLLLRNKSICKLLSAIIYIYYTTVHAVTFLHCSNMKREVTVELSSEGFLRTGIKSDMCQVRLQWYQV